MARSLPAMTANPASYQYGYDANGNLNSYKSPLAVAGTHNPVSYGYYTTGNGAKSQSRHENLHRCRKARVCSLLITWTDGYSSISAPIVAALLPQTTTFRYQDSRHQTVTVNELGNTRTHTFDTNGNPISIVDETGATRTYTYDPPTTFSTVSRKPTPAVWSPHTNTTTWAMSPKSPSPIGATTQYLNFTSFNAPQSHQGCAWAITRCWLTTTMAISPTASSLPPASCPRAGASTP